MESAHLHSVADSGLKLNLTHLLLPQFLLGLSQGTNNTLTTKSRQKLWEFTTVYIWGELSCEQFHELTVL